MHRRSQTSQGPGPSDPSRAEGTEPEVRSAAAGAEAERQLLQVLERVEMPTPARDTSDAPVLRIARVVTLQGRSARVSWRQGGEPLEAQLASEVEGELIARVVEERGLVLVEQGDELRVVGVLQTRERAPERPGLDEVSLRGRTVRLESEGELSMKADRVEIEGASEVLLRVGPVALRLRRDGSVELVGSSIYLTSRGVFRLIGRILRLN
jgi:hypothetical protein